jgi:NitT/TauT family transport system permease protein
MVLDGSASAASGLANLPGMLRRRPASRGTGVGVRVWLVRAALLVLLLGLWQWASDSHMINSLIFSKPTDVFQTLAKMLSGAQVQRVVIYPQIWATLSEMLSGYAIGATAAVIIGVTLARNRSIAQVTEPFMLAWYGLPIITLAPLFVLALGIGFPSKVATAFFATFFVVFFQTYSGCRSLKEEYFLLGRLMGASKLDLMRRVLIPGSLPFIFVGLRQAVPVAMTGAIVGEYIASWEGLGLFVLNAAASFDAAASFAGLVIVVTIVTTLSWLVRRAEGVVIRWQPADIR